MIPQIVLGLILYLNFENIMGYFAEQKTEKNVIFFVLFNFLN